MALCQNESKASKEAKAQCGAAIREVEACHTTLVREAEAHHTTIIREAEDDCATIVAEAHCTTNIRKAECHCMEKAHSIQQSHAEDMQHLEIDTMEEEGRDHLSFQAACGGALQVCPWSPNGPPSTTHGEHTCWPLF